MTRELNPILSHQTIGVDPNFCDETESEKSETTFPQLMSSLNSKLIMYYLFPPLIERLKNVTFSFVFV